ncbi:MAG: hypothetical protein IJ681_10065 [Bacteroidales bacterium]|nr:hypothetical protein [Bacteroidales bacterium]
MEPSRAETVLAKIVKVMFNHLTMPSLLFVLCSYMMPLSRLYFYIYPVFFIITLLLVFSCTALLPTFYQKHLNKQAVISSQREILIFSLIINTVSFLLMRTFLHNAIYIVVQSAFFITFIALTLSVIETYFTKVCINSTVMGIIALFILTYSLNTSFFLISTVLILLGLFISLLIVSGNSTIKQVVIGILTSVLTFGIYMLLP